MEAPYKVVDLSGTEHRVPTRNLKRISVPSEYPQPGTMVYVAVTREIRKRKFEYRPHEAFILEDQISRVWFTPDGTYHVELSNPYGIQEHFPTSESAMVVHPTISAVIRYAEFKKGEEKFDREHPVF